MREVLNRFHLASTVTERDRLAAGLLLAPANVRQPKGEQLRIFYPSVVSSAGYLGEGVLLEFGGRNNLEPDEKHDIEPYVRSVFPRLLFPSAKAVPVLSPQRTFWEKVTLVHAKCGRPSSLSGRDRIYRHWYDLAVLADHEIGRKALADRELLKGVVKYKKAFYRVGYADYDACLHGKTRFAPPEGKLADLEREFNEMKRKSMFEGTPPSFTQMMNRLNDSDWIYARGERGIHFPNEYLTYVFDSDAPVMKVGAGFRLFVKSEDGKIDSYSSSD